MNELQKNYGKTYGESQPEGKKNCRLQIFGFPCNQFGYQEPSENFELMNTLKYVRPGYGFVPEFPLSGKLFVNGRDEHEIFTYLKARCSSPMGLIANRTDITWTPLRNNDISWNFSKWLIRSNGHPYKRYTSRTTPQAIEDDIKKLLEECVNGSETKSTETGNNVPTGGSNNPNIVSPCQVDNAGAQVASNTVVFSSSNPIPAVAPVAQKQKRSHPAHDGLFY